MAESIERTMSCPACGGTMHFSGGVQTHDQWAERFECARCGHETVRSVGRGSI